MTKPTPKSYWDDKRALLDTKIEKMEESLRALREERNTCSCATRVPPEILTHIFLDVVNDIYESGEELVQQFYLPHVCRYWYDVALQSQEYWRYQPLYDGGRIRPLHLIERAEGRPLYLTGKLSVDNLLELDSPECDQVLSQAESVHILLCHDYHSSSSQSDSEDDPIPSVPGYLQAFLKSGAPNLKSLTLSAEDVSIIPRIPDDAFDGNIPCLRSLILKDVECPWLTSIFVLCVRGEGYPLGVLALELDIPLSTLITLVPRYSERLLLGPPHGCLDLEPLLFWIPAHLQKLNLGPTPVNTMHLEYRWDLVYHFDRGILRLYQSPDSIVDPAQLPKAGYAHSGLEVHFRLSYSEFPFHVVLPVMIPKLQLSTVQVLYLDKIPSLDVETALCGLTGVQTLCLSGRKSTKVLQDLIPTKSRREILLPALKNLVLHKTDLDVGLTHALSFVADRSEQYPVEKVYLSQCEHVREEYLESLRQHVSTVGWDGLDKECYRGTLQLRPGERVMGRRS
ncbi:hypothetical protein NLI96_g933 [Meripilus lineatus]|uniref:F-box domain-containing protein n=1 Tax=Meripilus lineatus TaxID=2056292 RepID=A0AAD5VCY9_9APHY|nr:hypothetical protein NLI96_g933 [Physisporinus lineatus]